MGETLLSRAPTSIASLTLLQAKVDSAVSSNTRQITDPQFIGASLVGLGAAAGTLKASYRFIDSLPVRLIRGRAGTFLNEIFPLLTASVGGSTAHEFAYRSLQHLSGSENPHLWRSHGRDGWGAGLIRSNISFGPSLGAGAFCFGGAKLWINPPPLIDSPKFVYTKGHFLAMGAVGILAFLGSYWGLSRGVNAVENQIFGERSASDSSLKKPDSSPASGR